MKAKDTVIKEILATHGYTVEVAAEILNNAGRAIYQAGIKEVVKWVRTNYPIDADKYEDGFRRFQAKLKDWGLDG